MLLGLVPDFMHLSFYQGSHRVGRIGKIMKNGMINSQLWKSRKTGTELGKVGNSVKIKLNLFKVFNIHQKIILKDKSWRPLGPRIDRLFTIVTVREELTREGTLIRLSKGFLSNACTIFVCGGLICRGKVVRKKLTWVGKWLGKGWEFFFSKSVWTLEWVVCRCVTEPT